MIRKVLQTAASSVVLRCRYFPTTSTVPVTLASVKDQLSSSLQCLTMVPSLFAPPQQLTVSPQLALDGQIIHQQSPWLDGRLVDDYDDDYSVWFAVPKSKHTRSRKRMKTTRQKRIPIKNNIVFDPRTGEVTLKHKLPFNWKDYLPKVE